MSMFFATAVTLQQNVKSAQPYPSEEGLTLALWLQHGLAGAFEPKLTVLPSPGHPKQKPLLQLTPKQPFLVNSISHAGLCVANLAETRSSARDATLKPLPWFAPRLAGCHDRRDRPSSPAKQEIPSTANWSHYYWPGCIICVHSVNWSQLFVSSFLFVTKVRSDEGVEIFGFNQSAI